MILYRELALNLSTSQTRWLTNAIAHALNRTDPEFEYGVIGATVMPVRFTMAPGPPERQIGQQLMLSFWAWGDNERDLMTNLDRTFRNMTIVLQELSEKIRRSPQSST